MILRTSLVVVLILLGATGSVMAADQETTVEFRGPWAFVFITNNQNDCGGTMPSCIVAVAPTQFHKNAKFEGGGSTPIQGGVYKLTLSGVKDAGKNYQPLLVSKVDNNPILAGRTAYQDLIKASD